MHYQFYQYLNQHNLLSGKQFGFRPKYSTVNAVSSFADEILLNMERGKLCGAVFLDLSKSFDMVDHTILLRKLSSFGVASDTAKWFELILMDECNVHLVVQNCLICYLLCMACLGAAYWALCYFLYI